MRHKEIQYSVYSPKQLYELVIDIDKYPEFLPWCSAARILEKKNNCIYAELVVSFKSFHDKYTSRVKSTVPEDMNKPYLINVDLIEGPFQFLKNYWQFERDEKKNLTKVSFEIDFAFRSPVLQKLIGLIFEKALVSMMTAFNQRAIEIYGDK
jgi:coenzyme Q-binding protein COQ10